MTSSRPAFPPGSLPIFQPVSLPVALAISLALLLPFLLAGCSPTRSVAKIGLAAPFEGVHRRTGYAALAAMRQAIQDAPTGPLGFIPLAEDTSLDPARTVAKILADPLVRAVIGPLDPAASAQVADRFRAREVDWIRPFAVDPQGGFARDPQETAWATALVQAVAGAAQSQGARRLVLAGWTPGWPQRSPAAWSQEAGLPVILSEDLTQAGEGEAVLWLGSPEDGVKALALLRSSQPRAPFWLAFQGEDPIFLERALAHPQLGPAGLGPLFWATWLDPGYDAWAQGQANASPAAYRLYRATQEAMAGITGQAPAPSPWQVAFFAITPAGPFQPFSRPESWVPGADAN